MGANGSREVSIAEGGETTKDSRLPRSSTLPAGLKGLGGKLSFSGSHWPRGLGLDSSLSVRLTKSKKLDGSPSKKDLDETKVEIVATDKEDEKEEGKAENEVLEETEAKEEVEEETMADFIESLLSKVVEDTIEKSRKMKKSSTLPATFRGLGNLNRSQSFGKRIRQSFRKLVNVKKPIVEKSEETTTEIITEEVKDVEIETIEENEAEDSGVVEESKISVEKKSVLKRIDFPAKKKQFQASLKAMVERKRKPKKESLELINTIIEEIINQVEVEEEEKSGEKALEEMLSMRDEELFATAATSAADKEQETVGVLDKSND